jgi:hypothetical protein
VSEHGGISRYAYWSDRRIRAITSENDIALERRLRWAARIRTIPFIPEFECGQEVGTLSRAEIARRIEAAIGDNAVEDFVTPPPVRFAKGINQVLFAQFAGVSAINDGVVCHISVRSSTGTRQEQVDASPRYRPDSHRCTLMGPNPAPPSCHPLPLPPTATWFGVMWNEVRQ